MRSVRALLVLAGLLAAVARPSIAVTVDGVLDPQYGAALVTQTTQTSFHDVPADQFYGSELDGVYALVSNDTLYLLITGNLNRFYSEFVFVANQLQLYFDTMPGGQDPIGNANPQVNYTIDLAEMTGLRFDTDFTPDFWIAGARDGSLEFHAFYTEMPAGGGGAGYTLGWGPLGGTGTLSGGTNPHGILAAMDISNQAGVTDGCGASSGAGVTTGAEFAIPLAAIGHPNGPFRVCALLVGPGVGAARVSNQALGPVPPGTCTLGAASTVDFSAIAGTQYFVVQMTTPAVRTSWGSIKAAYR